MALFIFFLLIFGAMAARLVVLQTVESPAYAKLAEAQRERSIAFPARRGAILDRAARPLALSVDYQTVFADPGTITNAPKEALKLARVLQMPGKTVRRSLKGTWSGDRFNYVARQVAPKQANAIRKMNLAGIGMQPEPKRVYPSGRLASQLLGFVNVDGSVLTGLELQYNNLLQGAPGHMTLEQDPAGNSLPQASSSYYAPTPGRSIFLTLDKGLQYFTQQTLKDAVRTYHAQSGTAIVMRPKTGEILALANAPDFNPNNYARFSPAQERNIGLTDVYEPGSAFKIITAAAALQAGAVTPHTTFTVPYQKQVADRIIHDAEVHGTEKMSVKQIIENSSNVGTVEIGLKLGARRLNRAIHDFGFGQRTGLDFPGESPGIVLPLSQWSGSTIANVPIGQGVAVTPLQLTSAYATLANRGVWVEPRLLYGTMGSNGKMVPAPSGARHRVVSAKTANQMADILTSVVRGGTGVEARIPGYDVAGKTGTAQKPINGVYTNHYMATFAGFAPAKDPAVVVLVVLNDPNPIWGGSTAAPTFKTITDFALRHLGVAPTGNAHKAARAIEAAQAQPGHV